MRENVKDFKDYYEKNYKDKTIDINELNSEIEKFKYYRNKIINGALTGFEYNSTLGNFEDDKPKSLQYFIERETTEVGSFGAIVSGKLALWIQGVGDSSIWHKRLKDESGKLQDEILDTEEKRDVFVKEINEFLKQVVTIPKLDDLVNYLDKSLIYQSIASSSFIIKIIIFNSLLEETKDFDYHNKLIFIYDFYNTLQLELIDRNKDLFDDARKETNILKRNKEITIKTLNALEIKDEDVDKETIIRIERLLWELTEDENRALILSPNKKNIIFYGAPGTGKTYIVKKTLDNNENIEETKYVQFHPSFTYEDFIEGIKPLGVDSNGNLKLGVVNGCFKELCMHAKSNLDKQYYFVVDEINRANLSSVFGETLSLLENDYRWNDTDKKNNYLETPLSKVIETMINNEESLEKKQELIEKYAFIYKDGHVYFGIPENIHFIGMMNDCDKSIDSFDLALRRRFTWKRMNFDQKPIEYFLKENGINEKNRTDFIKSCLKLNHFITGIDYGNSEIGKLDSLNMGSAFEIGHAIFMKLENENLTNRSLKRAKEALWNEHLEPVVKEYLRSSYLESDIDSKLKEARDLFLEN